MQEYTHIHTHTHNHSYMCRFLLYIYVCVCVCVFVYSYGSCLFISNNIFTASSLSIISLDISDAYPLSARPNLPDILSKLSNRYLRGSTSFSLLDTLFKKVEKFLSRRLV
eukprot:GHVR01181937.1.p1 GENE.GHVR01181937.1~~GHVR01181937.1.p1  ORF type:complete len:110 (-),score=35.41 GHVR01181937.1:481-810(-)